MAAAMMMAAPAAGAAEEEFNPLQVVSDRGYLGSAQAQPPKDLLSVDGAEQLAQLAADRTSAMPADFANIRELHITAITEAPRVSEGENVSAVDASGEFGFVEGRSAVGTNAAFVVIRSADAPRSYQFEVGGGGDLTLQQSPDGSILVKDPAGEVVNFLQRPWAEDANGVAIPTTYSVEGTTVTQTVDATGAAFPVVADPSYGCGVPWCSIYWNKSETNDWATGGVAALGGVTAACGLGGPVAVAACGAASGAIGAMAIIANNNGNCIGFLFQPLGWNPFIHSDEHCT